LQTISMVPGRKLLHTGCQRLFIELTGNKETNSGCKSVEIFCQVLSRHENLQDLTFYGTRSVPSFARTAESKLSFPAQKNRISLSLPIDYGK